MLIIEEGKDYDGVLESQLPYKLLQNLGHGGSGFVEKVQDRLTSHLFARKIIRRLPRKASREEQTAVFRNEVNILRRLGSHRHIISLFASYTTKSDFGLILQPVASDKDLAYYLEEYHSVLLANNASLPNRGLQNMRTVLEQAFGCLISGLAYMHEKKVRHKDVKPQNILIHQGQVVYTDFGYSFNSSERSQSITEGKPGPMTAKYSAPEVLACDSRSSSSDIYSLGCVFINILFALTSASTPDIQEIPSFADSMDVVHQHIAEWQTDSHTALLPSIITSMTKRDPSKRWCAAQLDGEICRLPGLSCQECTLRSIDPVPRVSPCSRTQHCYNTVLLNDLVLNGLGSKTRPAEVEDNQIESTTTCTSLSNFNEKFLSNETRYKYKSVERTGLQSSEDYSGSKVSQTRAHIKIDRKSTAQSDCDQPDGCLDDEAMNARNINADEVHFVNRGRPRGSKNKRTAQTTKDNTKTSNLTSAPQPSKPKRPRIDRDDNDDQEEHDDEKEPLQYRIPKQFLTTCKLACPFAKRVPLEYPQCRAPDFRDNAKVK